MYTGLLITIGILVFTVILSRTFGETKATNHVAREIKELREMLEQHLTKTDKQ